MKVWHSSIQRQTKWTLIQHISTPESLEIKGSKVKNLKNFKS